ncbi:MAG: hypothetical protein QUS33_02055 [Dehalococcoidia bacterium]|nr:hypothetical protein [Dehalococcoidia bacterium]
MDDYVARVFDVDFIYLDLLFCAVWMLVLLRQKQTLALWFGLFGAVVVFLVDDVLWLRIQHTRFLDVPFNRDLFLAYFSFTYGMIEFSYVTVMFGAKSTRARLLWTLFLYGGWMATALISQNLSIDDRTIDIGRDMSNARIVQVAMVVCGYVLLLLLKYIWRPMKTLTLQRIIYLFAVGVIVHFGMEITLLASGIRPAKDYVDVLLFNSLLEFNMGIPILYVLWTAVTSKTEPTTAVRESSDVGTSPPSQR